MKMTKKAIDATIFTVIALIAILAFGYSFRMFQEINAMDLGGAASDSLGIAATDMVEDESKATDAEVAAVKNAETVINNCMTDEDILSSVRADYENHRMVYLMLADGTEKIAAGGDADEWNKVRELGLTASLDGEKILEGNGLDGWSFDVEILNDSDPYKAVLTFQDGECTYDCLSK